MDLLVQEEEISFNLLNAHMGRLEINLKDSRYNVLSR